MAPQDDSLLLHRNSQCLHLSIQVAALEAKYVGRAADVAVIVVELFQNVIAFVGGACLMQGQELSSSAPAAIAINQWRQMFALETAGGWIHDYDAFDDVAQFAHISRPRVTHQDVNRVVGDFSRLAPILT